MSRRRLTSGVDFQDNRNSRGMAAQDSGSVGPGKKDERAELQKRVVNQTEEIKRVNAEMEKMRQAVSEAKAKAEEANQKAAQEREAANKAEAETEKIRQEAIAQRETDGKALAEADKAVAEARKAAREAEAEGSKSDASKAKRRRQIIVTVAAGMPGVKEDDVREGAMLPILEAACRAIRGEYIITYPQPPTDEEVAAMMAHAMLIWAHDTRRHGTQANAWGRGVSVYLGVAMAASTVKYVSIVAELSRRVGEFMQRVRPLDDTTEELLAMQFDPNGAKSPREWVAEYCQLRRLNIRGAKAQQPIDLLHPPGDEEKVPVDPGSFSRALYGANVPWKMMVCSNALIQPLSPDQETHMAWLEQCWAAWRARSAAARKHPAASAVSFQLNDEDEEEEVGFLAAAAAIDGRRPPRFTNKPAAAGGGQNLTPEQQQQQQQRKADRDAGHCYKCHRGGHRARECPGGVESLQAENLKLKKELEELRKSKN